MKQPTYLEVEAQLRQLGFEQWGLLTLPELPLEGDRLKNWLSQGFHGEMAWMVNHLEKRVAPLSLMPETQSILCVAINYYPGDLPEDAEAKVARYAQGDDYHEVLKQKLKALLAWMQTFNPEIQGRPLTDSAPIMEKALAVKAGLGWQGKHSNLITRNKGSWVFLGELLLNIVFPDAPESNPMQDLCGRCTRCIDACPTDAIVEPYQVDATKCISYWTIEYKGESFPEEIQENLNGWVFGCDICQEVCPWNIKFQQVSPEQAFIPRPWNLHPRLDEIAALTPERFKRRYRKSPVKRVKLHGLQRNAHLLKSITLP